MYLECSLDGTVLHSHAAHAAHAATHAAHARHAAHATHAARRLGQLASVLGVLLLAPLGKVSLDEPLVLLVLGQPVPPLGLLLLERDDDRPATSGRNQPTRETARRYVHHQGPAGPHE